VSDERSHPSVKYGSAQKTSEVGCVFSTSLGVFLLFRNLIEEMDADLIHSDRDLNAIIPVLDHCKGLTAYPM
jgi:hypothetical protein